MRAAVYTRYGPPEVVEIAEVPTPVPRDHEIRIKVRATTVSSADWRARSLTVPAGFGVMARLFFGIRRPRQPILGTEAAGDIDAVGAAVRNFKVGDAVFAFSGAKLGCHAEYCCLRDDGFLALKPPNLSYEEAAALSFGGTTALGFLRRAKIHKGEKVLVNGASGAVGTAAVQLAKHFGAQVTGVCSTANLELVRSLGADAVIDYTREDFTKHGVVYDLIVDTAGTAGVSRSLPSLADGGRLLLVLAGLADIARGAWVSLAGRKKVIAGPESGRPEDLRFLAALAAAGELRPVIDRRFPFAQIVEAHRRVDSGHKRGSVVVTM